MYDPATCDLIAVARNIAVLWRQDRTRVEHAPLAPMLADTNGVPTTALQWAPQLTKLEAALTAMGIEV